MSDTTPEPTEKQQAVLEWIKSNQNDEPDKHDIAAEFGVEPDTAKYYVERLRECGFDIPYVPTGPKSGFYAYEGEDDIPKGLITDLEEGGLTYEQLQDEYDLSKAQAKSLLDDLREEGRPIEFEEIDGQGTRLWYLADERDKKYAAGDGDGVYRFALISDTHLGSKAEHLDELHDFYDRIVAKGIDTVYHAGDISDGYRVYRHHVNELKPDAIGWQRLRQYVQTHYPQRDGVTTHFITGNHDYKFYKQNGLHFGKLLDEDRPDLNWLGEMQATIVFDAENGIDLELIHPSGGTPYCYDGQTEVLTERHGYVRLDEFQSLLKEEDTVRVATFDMDSGEMEFQKPEKHVAIEYEGEMVDFGGQGLDLRVTPNHRMVVRKNESHHGNKGGWKIEEARDLKENYIRQKWDIPKTGKWVGEEPPEQIHLAGEHFNANDFSARPEPFLRFLGWYVSEGHTRGPGRIHISQTTGQEEIAGVLQEIGLTANVLGDKINTTNKALSEWLEENVGTGAKNKRIPVWVKRLSPEYLEIFLESLFDGDGHRDSEGKKKGYTTASEQLADDVVECLLKTGRSASVNEREREYEINGYVGETKTYDVCVGHTKRGTEPSICTEPSTTDFEGFVYCLEVPNETLFVRRNGKTAVSGNTVGYRAQTLYRERPPENRPTNAGIGHLHDKMHANAEGVEAFYTGCWQGPTPYIIRKGLPTKIGGWIVELEIENGHQRRLSTDWIDYEVRGNENSYAADELAQL